MTRTQTAICLAIVLSTMLGSGCFNPAGDSEGPNGIKCHTENTGFLFWAHVETTCYDASGKVITGSPNSATQ